MVGRLPSITENPDKLVLGYALTHEGELPGWMSEYTRDALVTAGWITDGKLNEDGMDAARRWAAAAASVNAKVIIGRPYDW